MKSLKSKLIKSLTPKDKLKLSRLLEYRRYRWGLNAREKQIIPPDSWTTWLILAGRGYGKMIDITIPIPTTNGWKLLENIRSGDYVFNLDGQPVKVLEAHQIQKTDGYKITFDTGETINACKDHLWYTITKNEDKRIRRGTSDSGSIKTTQEIAETLKHLARETNHRIPIASPINYNESHLPIKPYTLGVWLGDGSSANGEITVAEKEQILHIQKDGYSVDHKRDLQYLVGGKKSKRNENGQFVANDSLHSKLSDLALLKNKHIPDQYKQGSIYQRSELLKGLMDSDGCCDKTGWCEFVSIKERLAYDVFELISSLGIKSRIGVYDSKYYGKLMGKKYRIFFKTDQFVFKLSRKKNRQAMATKAQMSRHKNRFIVDAKPVKGIPMRCLTVDSEDGLFLIGKSFIATHNTRVGSETVRIWKDNYPIIHMIARTAADARDTMVEGDSGILACSPDSDRPLYEPSKRRLTWDNGAKAILFSAEEPDALRGPQCYKAWADETASWKYDQDTWDMMQMGLRLGDNPQCVVTTTPRPTTLIRELVKDENTHVTKGTTYENRANLSESFFDFVIKKYEGTMLGRQELNAELLEDIEGALWTNRNIDQNRVTKLPDLKRIVIPIDPAATSKADSDETGIIPVGIDHDGIGYVLEDLSGIFTPNKWAGIAIDAYHRHKADRIIGEANNGGDMISTIIRNIDPEISYQKVWASRSKQTRAEPIAALYEQNRVKHFGNLAELETEMTTWDALEGSKSPNRIDSLVWGLTQLMLKGREEHISL